MRNLFSFSTFAGGYVLAMMWGCRPEFGERASQVTERRVLAVQSNPAEVAPLLLTPVTYRALVVDANGPEPNVAIDWAYCTRPKPVAELNDVTRDCLDPYAAPEPDGNPGTPFLQPLETAGAEATGTVPSDACRQFGPDVPEVELGKPQGRPADPDDTGGFYQPVRLLLVDGERYLSAIANTRITCDLPDATLPVQADYANRYRPNENPEIESATILAPGESQPTVLVSDEEAAAARLPEEPAVVARSARVLFRTTWPACPTAPACGNGYCEAREDAKTCPADCPTDQFGRPLPARNCPGSEVYAYHDLVTQNIVDRRESIRVSWYATAGAFDANSTGRTEEEAAIPYTENTFTAPDQAGSVVVWIVVRDDRGGVGFRTYHLELH